jgi:hypothetical protein
MRESSRQLANDLVLLIVQDYEIRIGSCNLSLGYSSLAMT